MSVYFAEAGNYTKIGYSASPIKRASSLTTNGARPDDLERGAPVDLLGWIPGDRWREGEIQAAFIDRRVKGEWFHRIDPDVIEKLIWDDPAGIDLQRMTMPAVFCAHKYPDITRAEMEIAGITVLGNLDMTDLFGGVA